MIIILPDQCRARPWTLNPLTSHQRWQRDAATSARFPTCGSCQNMWRSCTTMNTTHIPWLQCTRSLKWVEEFFRYKMLDLRVLWPEVTCKWWPAHNTGKNQLDKSWIYIYNIWIGDLLRGTPETLEWLSEMHFLLVAWTWRWVAEWLFTKVTLVGLHPCTINPEH